MSRSAARFDIAPASIEHCHNLAPRLREEDKRELWAADRLFPMDALSISLNNSTHAWACLHEGNVVCMWGVVPVSLVGGDAVSWMLASDLVVQHKRAFVLANRFAMSAMLEHYSHLFNVVDSRYTDSINWLKWLGYQVSEPFPFGPFGQLFCRVDYWR